MVNSNRGMYYETSVFILNHYVIKDSYKLSADISRFSVNFEGTMNTDLVYEQTQVQLKSKMYTASEVEGNFYMDGYDNVSLSLKLPLKKFNLFSLEYVKY